MKKWFTRIGLALALFAGPTSAMAQETLVVDGSKSYLWTLTQGTDYRLPGTDESWYAMPGFFTHKEGDVWTFNAYGDVDYAYAIVLDEQLKYIKVEHLQAGSGEGVDDAPTATYDTAGAVYMNGNGNIGFPTFSQNAPNWGGGKDVPVPQIDNGIYQLVLICGKQIDPTSINFKFFKGKNWGGDMGTTVLWLADNDYIYMGQQGDATGDNGNLYGKGGDLGDLDTLIVTIDKNTLTNGLATVTVEKKAYTPSAYPQINGENLTKFGNAYYADLALTKGTVLEFTNLDAIDLNWDDIYVNEYFAKKDANGKLTFNAVAGNYCIAIIPSLNYIRIYPGTFNAPATYQDGKAIWIVGNSQIGLPSYAAMPSNWGAANNWSPTLDHSLPVAMVGENIYKISFTVGQELGSDVNFKFYSAGIGWGTEFRGEDLEMEANDYLILNQPEAVIGYDENGNEKLTYGDEDGNIRNGDTPLGKGDKVILTVDLNDFEFHYFDPIDFVTVCKRGKVTVEVIPSEAPKPQFGGVNMNSDGDWYYADVQLERGKTYEVKNLTEVSCDELYTDVCFATYEGDNKFTAKALSGNYCVAINTTTKYFKVFPGTKAAPASIADGGLWIIGQGFGRPTVNGNAADWNTGALVDFPVAQTAPGIYQMDLTCDVEMWDSWCNFKFFGQPGWGIEFKNEGDYALTTENDYLGIGTGDGTHDAGNIYFLDGASFVKGEPIYIVVDLTAGNNAGVLKVSTEPIVDGIKNVMTIDNATENAIYNLNGVRVNNTNQYGIYIVNGKKIVK